MLTHHSDGELLASWRIVDGQLVRTMTQPREDLILEANAELRKSPEALRPLSYGAWMLCMPELNFLAAQKKHPDLASLDSHTRYQAWKKFINSSEAAPYRVKHKARQWHS